MSKLFYLTILAVGLFLIPNSSFSQSDNAETDYQRFYGLIIENGIDLIWLPKSEGRRDYFVIEFQTADDQWEVLEKLPSFGSATRSRKYHFKHLHPLLGRNYYRLSQYNQLDEMVLRENALVIYQQINKLTPHLETKRVKDFASIDSPFPAILSIHSKDQYNIVRIQIEKGRNMIDLSNMAPGEYIFEFESFEDTFVTRLSVEE